MLKNVVTGKTCSFGACGRLGVLRQAFEGLYWMGKTEKKPF